jgi:hypothetical protein
MRLISVALCALFGCESGASTTPTTQEATTTVATASASAIDCGEDFSSLDQLGPPSVSRTCFLEANAAGKPATLRINEVGATGRFSAVLVTNPDRTVEVTPDGGTPSSTCSGLALDDRLVFRLAGCDPPLPD